MRGARRRVPRRIGGVPGGRGAIGGLRTSRRVILFVVFLSAGGLILSWFLFQTFEIRSLRRELRALGEAQAEALHAQELLRARLAEADDLEAIETEARARLGWVMQGEEKVIFVLPEEE